MFEIFIVAASPSRQLKFRRRQWALIKQSVASYRKWRSCFATLMENLMITNSQGGRGGSLTRKNGRREYWLYSEVLLHGEWCLVVRSIIAQGASVIIDVRNATAKREQWLWMVCYVRSETATGQWLDVRNTTEKTGFDWTLGVPLLGRAVTGYQEHLCTGSNAAMIGCQDRHCPDGAVTGCPHQMPGLNWMWLRCVYSWLISDFSDF